MNELVTQQQIEESADDISGAHPLFRDAPQSGEVNKLRKRLVRLTREAFYQEFRARGGVVLGSDAPPPPAFVDREVVQGGKVSRASDYIALLRDLAALPPNEALAQFDLDEASYLEVAKAWAAAMENDPTIARTISAGLAKR